MNCLLDTHAWIWFAQNDSRLSLAARKTLEQPGTRILLCSVSIWEMAIKTALRKLDLPYNLDDEISDLMVKAKVDLIEPELSEYQALTQLPFHHRDPFDRLLAVVALRLKCPIISRDVCFDGYGVQRTW